MLLNFTQLSMTELRNRPGEILDRTSNDGEAFIIERNGQRKACLVPLSFFFPDISPRRIADEIEDLIAKNEEPRPLITENRELSFRFSHSLDDKKPIELLVELPHGYPNNCPRVIASPIDKKSPHLWADGALCLYGVMSGWNPGKHNVYSTLVLARKWLANYDAWRKSGTWPEFKGIENDG